MTPQGITRRLIAILSADVKDYTRLISYDDVGTARTLTAYMESSGSRSCPDDRQRRAAKVDPGSLVLAGSALRFPVAKDRESIFLMTHTDAKKGGSHAKSEE